MPRRKGLKPLPKISGERMLNGAVCAQYKKCGKGNCKCTRGELHGPYFYRFQWYGGRMVKEYVRLSRLEETKAACASYRKMQAQIRANNRRFYAMLSAFKGQLKELSL